MSPALSRPARLLAWCALGTVLVALVLARHEGNPRRFSAIFWHLLTAYDAHGNVLLAAIAAVAFALRGRPQVLAVPRHAGERPWAIAGAAFVVLCLGARGVYHAFPLSMDEYTALFQAKAFAAGRLAGLFPPALLDHLIPSFFQSFFFTVSRATGEVAATSWPGFPLLLAPFAWLGVPWAANPLIGALSLVALHRLALVLTGSREAAGWAILLAAASPAFVVLAISYYAMPAHLLCSLLYALLLLEPTPRRALLAGVVGSVALTLHNPVPHLLFAAPFLAWLVARRRFGLAGALLAGYLPLVLLLGFGWQHYLGMLAAPPAAAASPLADAAAAGESLLRRAWSMASPLLTIPRPFTIEARIAGLSKVWTWGAAGLMVLAAWGYAAARDRPGTRLLGAALALTFFGYFLVPFDQGHGWGYRYLHSAWFVLPLLAASALAPGSSPAAPAGTELRAMACWAALLSLVAANGLRLVQAETFIARQLAQAPPLAGPADPTRREAVFLDIGRGFYVQDLVQNDPFLRGPRIVLVYRGADATRALMEAHLPGFRRADAGPWGEHWVGPPAAQ